MTYFVQDEATKIDEEEDEEFRQLELKYEALYKQIYDKRERVILGADVDTQELLSEYEQRTSDLTSDPDFKKVEFEAIDVKDI